MNILFSILAVVMLIFTIDEKNMDAKKQYAYCYSVTLVMAVLNTVVTAVFFK